MMKMFRSWYYLESEYFINTDLLRFFASAGIVIYHFSAHCIDFEHSSLLIRSIWSNLSILVDMFFVVSGVVIYSLYNDRVNNLRTYISYLRKRIARLAPLHYATLLIFLGIFCASKIMHQNITAENYDMRCLPAQITFTHAWGFCKGLTFNGPSWSVSAEMGVYLLTPVLLLIATRTVPTIAAVAAVMWLSAAIPDGEQIYTRTFALGVLRAIPGFLVGACIAAHRANAWTRLCSRVPLTLAFMAFVFSPILISSPVVRIFVAYLVAAIAFARDVEGNVAPGVRRYAPWGKLTYSLYMLHAPLLAIVVNLGIERLGHLTGTLKIVAIAFTAGVALPLLAIMSLQLFEIPARRFLSGAREVGRDRRIAVEIAP